MPSRINPTASMTRKKRRMRWTSEGGGEDGSAMDVSAAFEIPGAGEKLHQSSLHQDVGRNSGLP